MDLNVDVNVKMTDGVVVYLDIRITAYEYVDMITDVDIDVNITMHVIVAVYIVMTMCVGV